MLTEELFNFVATKTDVGPSTPPITEIALLFIFNAAPIITNINPTIPATITNIFSLVNLLYLFFLFLIIPKIKIISAGSTKYRAFTKIQISKGAEVNVLEYFP